MPAKRIPQLDPISGASTANDDNLVIFDTDADETKRILRSQLAAAIAGDLPYTPAGSISATTIPTAIAEIVSDLAAAGGAALVGNTPSGTISSTTVQGAIDEIVGDLAAAGGAGLVGFTPSGSLVATTVQGAITEVITDFAANSGASLLGFVQSGGGAANRTVQAKLRDVVYVTDFDTVDPTGSVDSSTGIQNAIDTGKTVVFPDGTYRANNLVLSTVGQQLIGLGNARIIKNANGPILTVSGLTCGLTNLQFRGESATPTFTGDNLVITANDVDLINCGSRWAYGRAVKCTGSQLNIDGSNDVYQTADATATGYDIEVGDGSNTCYYTKIFGINSTQATGGIWLRAPGVAAIMGCQFGKLNIDPGIGGAGQHGPLVSSCRINGKTTIGVSSSIFSSTTCSADVEIVGGVTSVMLGDTFVMSAGTTLTISNTCTRSTMNLSSLEGLGVTIVGDGGQNSISRFGAAYTPTWTATSSNPSLGNGTIYGHYTREGRTVTVTVTLTMGSTTTYGTGTWEISVPIARAAVDPKAVGQLYMVDSGTIFRVGVAILDGGASKVSFIADSASAGVGATNPFTWASGDSLTFTITYVAA